VEWLRDRERSILGRGLSVDEVAHVRDTARRSTTNYTAIAANIFPWPPQFAPS
jgi:hypothetical protein